MRRGSAWAGVLWLLLGLCAAAQPVEPTPLYLLLVDGGGRWRAEQQERFQVPPGLAGQPLSTDWKAAINTRAFRRLSYADRLELMAYPERLLASTWARQYFSADHVMVLQPMGAERVQGRLFDVSTSREHAIVAAREGAEVEPRSAALQQALEKTAMAQEPVVVHPDGLYHRSGASHLSETVHYEPVESAQRAEAFAFVPCGICYPESSRDPLYDDLDRSLGQVVAAQIEATYPLAAEGESTRRVRQVGARLLKENRYLDQGYRFEVLDTDTINAYAAPTGPLYVTQGLLDALESDDELAAVLGHELSHSERRHARRQYEAAQQTGMIGMVITLATGLPFASLGTDILGTVLVRGYSRGYELEADRDGMMAAYAAGYRPEDYLRVQDKLEEVQRQKGGSGPGWLQTHPAGDERKEQLTEILQQTATLRERLDRLEQWDPGLAVYLKGRALFLNDDQTALSEYLTRYETLAKLVDTTPRTNPPGVPLEVFDALKAVLPLVPAEVTMPPLKPEPVMVPDPSSTESEPQPDSDPELDL